MMRANVRINIRIKNIRIFEYSNIFVTLWTRLAPVLCFYNLNSIFYHWYQQNIHKKSIICRENQQKHLLNLFVSWKLIQTNIRIYSNKNLATNEYPNIFVSKKLTRTNIRIYSYPKYDTNEYPNKYSDQKYLNIQIFEYIRHTLLQALMQNGSCWITEQTPEAINRSSHCYNVLSLVNQHIKGGAKTKCADYSILRSKYLCKNKAFENCMNAMRHLFLWLFIDQEWPTMRAADSRD